MSGTEENTTIEPDWDDIKSVYMASEGDLMIIAREYGLSVPDILIKARNKGWGERGSREETKEVEKKEAKDTSQMDVLAGHKSTAMNIRELISDSVSKIKDSEGGIKETVGAIKSLADSLVKIAMIERQAHEIDTAASDSPDSIIINMGGKRVEVTCKTPSNDES